MFRKKPDGTNAYTEYLYMNSDEIANFNYLYQKPGMRNLAFDYLNEVVSYRIQAVQAEVTKAKVKDWVSKGFFPTLGANVYSVLQRIQSGLGAFALLGEHARNIHGNEYHPLHMNSIAQMPGMVSGAIREKTAEYMTGAWPLIYQTVMSAADSLAAGAIGVRMAALSCARCSEHHMAAQKVHADT